MEKQLLVLRYKDEETEFSFEDKVTFIQDKRLIADLSKPNIKNQDSSLLIKSLEDTHISDVLQIKVNILEYQLLLFICKVDSFHLNQCILIPIEWKLVNNA